MIKIAAAILATGGSGTVLPDALQPYGGKTRIRALTREACAASFAEVAVVVGAFAKQVRPELAGLPVVTLPNPLWLEGIASSIRVAVAWAVCIRCDALVLVGCDRPELVAGHLDQLCAAYRLTRRSVGSSSGGRVDLPAVFDSVEFPRLFDLAGDVSVGSVLVAAHPATVDWPDGVLAAAGR